MYKQVIDRLLKNTKSIDKVLIFIPPYLGFSIMKPGYIYFYKSLECIFNQGFVFCEDDLETKILVDCIFSQCTNSIYCTPETLFDTVQKNTINFGFFSWHTREIKQFLAYLTKSYVPAVKAGGCYFLRLSDNTKPNLIVITKDELLKK